MIDETSGGVADDAWRRHAEREARLALIPPGEQGFFELVTRPDFQQINTQIEDVGACEHPVWLRGRTVVSDASGAVVREFSSDGTPFEAVPIRCMNRRASRCAPCSRLYQGDTFQLVMAGLVGGKGVPEQVALHPFVFATLTAGSFGPVHRRPDPDKPNDRCRPRRDDPHCEHGQRQGCALRHEDDDKIVGQPLCPECYDYQGHVLWNAHASVLWKAFTDTLYHRLAQAGGVPRSEIRRVLRVEYVRSAEYQARGIIHFHVILRLDGPDDRADDPPAWADAEVLADAVRSAAATVTLAAPESAALGTRTLRFGPQIDARPVVLDRTAGLSAEQVAGYMAKYVTKGTEDAHGSDVPITDPAQIEWSAATAHVAALMHACLRVGGLREYRDVRLGQWAHMLGYRGHVLTCSRRFSTTFGALRRVRAEYRRGDGSADVPGTVREARWTYAGQGWPSAALAEQAAGIYEDGIAYREILRDARDDMRRDGEAA